MPPARQTGVCRAGGYWLCGGVLLSHRVSPAVPSALAGLASGFGMGPGVSPPPWPPQHDGTLVHLLPAGGWWGVREPDSGCERCCCRPGVSAVVTCVLGG